jgi:hypothetical protein
LLKKIILIFQIITISLLVLQVAKLIALKSAKNALKFCNSLLIEISKIDIYENKVLWPALKKWLIKRNFYPTAELLGDCTDVLFIRK